MVLSYSVESLLPSGEGRHSPAARDEEERGGEVLSFSFTCASRERKGGGGNVTKKTKEEEKGEEGRKEKQEEEEGFFFPFSLPGVTHSTERKRKERKREGEEE